MRTPLQEFQVSSNIPETGFSATDNVSEHSRRRVNIYQSGIFTLSRFSLIQLFHGQLCLTGKNISKEEINLCSKLAIYAIDYSTALVDANLTIGLVRSEVQLLRTWLEARMSHCEQEREGRITIHDGPGVHVLGKIDLNDPDNSFKPVPQEQLKFNPDTYIAQKFLLLELREWLLGEILDY